MFHFVFLQSLSAILLCGRLWWHIQSVFFTDCIAYRSFSVKHPGGVIVCKHFRGGLIINSAELSKLKMKLYKIKYATHQMNILEKHFFFNVTLTYWFIDMITNSTATTTVTLPYSKTITFILDPYKICIAHQPVTILWHLLTNVKDKDISKSFLYWKDSTNLSISLVFILDCLFLQADDVKNYSLWAVWHIYLCTVLLK